MKKRCIINLIKILFISFLIYGCSKLEVSSGEYNLSCSENTSLIDSIVLKNIKKSNSEFDFLFSIKKTRNKKSLSFMIIKDSLYVIDGADKYFFLKFDVGYHDTLPSQKSLIPNSFLPFGNIVVGIEKKKFDYIVKFARYGSFTLSNDKYISQIRVSKNFEIKELHYFNGADELVFR